ncbi:hypothetical protein F4561_002611 [Lipingzhangella halophila]|uniref:Uncharacterized protein n=1 Tax=Lipingzhangella halophila TaxID=1783352 RepID=A0A7W7RGX5_9ACTN|nr:hypothetical protein [Lipingzhangella halophila]MBB4931791.1 hypothetical protein [Lipingzhangella halophila]
MTEYLIRAEGCDASNPLVMELTETEAATIRRASEALNAASHYECMPRLYIKPVAEAKPHELPDEDDE